MTVLVKKLRATVKVAEGGVERWVDLKRGDPVPSSLAEGELERLTGRGVLGTEQDVALASVRPEAPPIEEALVREGQEESLQNLAGLSDERLAALYGSHPPTVKQLLDAVGDDAETARRVLAAEQKASKGEPRKSLVDGLARVIEAGDGS